MASEMKPPPEPQPNDLDWVCGGCGGGVDMMDEFDAYCSNCGEGDPSLRALWGHEWAAVAMMAAQQQLGVALVKETGPCPSNEAAFVRWREWLEYEFLSCEENERAVFELLGLRGAR